jgi:hypothetical protein
MLSVMYIFFHTVSEFLESTRNEVVYRLALLFHIRMSRIHILAQRSTNLTEILQSLYANAGTVP